MKSVSNITHPLFRTTILLFLIAAGCASPRPDRLQSSAAAYHDALKWGEYHRAEHFVGETSRDVFQRRSKELEVMRLRIVDYEILNLETDPSGRRGTVRVRTQFYREREGKLHEVSHTEQWTWEKKTWRLAPVLDPFFR